jgi:hypothetical protein
MATDGHCRARMMSGSETPTCRMFVLMPVAQSVGALSSKPTVEGKTT